MERDRAIEIMTWAMHRLYEATDDETMYEFFDELGFDSEEVEFCGFNEDGTPIEYD